MNLIHFVDNNGTNIYLAANQSFEVKENEYPEFEKHSTIIEFVDGTELYINLPVDTVNNIILTHINKGKK